MNADEKSSETQALLDQLARSASYWERQAGVPKSRGWTAKCLSRRDRCLLMSKQLHREALRAKKQPDAEASVGDLRQSPEAGTERPEGEQTKFASERGCERS